MSKILIIEKLKSFCIFGMIIVLVSSINVTMSRYIREATAQNSIIAVPVLTLSNNNQQYEIEDMLPGDVKEYTFSVSNKSGTQINEVLLSYYFEINFESDIPLQFKLFDITDGTEKELTITNQKTSEIELLYDQEVIKNYKLKIIWNESDNSYTYAGREITCDINLTAVQVVG